MAHPDGCPGVWTREEARPDLHQWAACPQATVAWDAWAGVLPDAWADARSEFPDVGAERWAGQARAFPEPGAARLQTLPAEPDGEALCTPGAVPFEGRSCAAPATLAVRVPE
jgi:hypothetical protein